MHTSVRDTAANCLDKTGSLSVRRHVYGYIWGDMDRTLSLKEHLRLIKGECIQPFRFFGRS